MHFSRLGLSRSFFLSRSIVYRQLSTGRPQLIKKTVDKPLPDVLGKQRQSRRYFLTFCGLMALSLAGMVKYEAANSPIVTSTLQALRRSPLTLEALGPNIRFCSSMPWISGNSGIAKEVVDFSYEAQGDLASATVRFRAVKVPYELRYNMEKWSITPHEGPLKDTEISLLDEAYVPYVPMSNLEEPKVVPKN